MTRWIENAHPDWYQRVLRKLEEKYPEIADEVWSEAISDNAREQVQEQASREYRDHAVWGGKGPLWFNRRPPKRRG